jgi:hypothetical protein
MARYYIDQTGGNDANDGLSTGAAWKTKGKCSTVMVGGNIFDFKGGETWSEAGLSISAAVTVTSSWGTGLPIFDGAGSYVGFYLDAADGAQINLCEFRNTTAAGMYGIDVRTGATINCQINLCTFTSGQYGVRSESLATIVGGGAWGGNLIYGCTFGPTDGALSEDGVSINGAWACEVSACDFRGIGIGGAGGAGDPVSCHNTCVMSVHDCTLIGNRNGALRHVNTAGTSVFYNNYVYWNDEGGTTIVHQEGGGNLDVWNCEIVATGSAAVQIIQNHGTTAGGSTTRCWNVTVKNLVNNTNAFSFDNQRPSGAATTTLHVYNCISYLQFPANGRHIRSNSASTVYAGDYNSFSSTAAGRFVTSAGTDFAGWKTHWAGQDANSVTGDPSMSNNTGTAEGDAALLTGSNCKDAGSDLSANGFTTDYVGVTRPSGSAWDIGAYEFLQSPPTRMMLMGVGT